MTADLVVSALRNVIRLRNPQDTVVHSDRGSPVSINGVRALVEEQRPRRFDGTRGDSRRQRGDGIVSRAVAEERVEHTRMGTREELRFAIVTGSNAPITDGIASVVSGR
jgi:hypothetical protein